MANYREYLSGMGDGLLSPPALDEQMNTGGRGISANTGSGFFIDDTEIPAATWSEDQEFDSYGNPIPVFEQQVTTIHEPRSMTPPEVEQSIYDMQYTQAQMNQAAKNLDALEAWKDEFLSALTGLMSSSSKANDI